jgi:hypothetical protein
LFEMRIFAVFFNILGVWLRDLKKIIDE